MSATVNSRIQLKRDTTENWNNAVGFIPLPGEVIVYTDYETKTYQTEEYGETVTKTVQIPNIKIGTGNAYVQDLAFVDEKNVGRSSYEALDLAVIYVKYEQFVTDLTFEDVKKEGNEGFSFETIINDMKAEIAQRWEVLKAQLPVIGGGEDPTNP